MVDYLMLIIACAVFVGSHFLMSHSWRAAMVKAFGNNGFLGVYSLVSLGSLIWMVLAFSDAPTGTTYWDMGDTGWIISSLLTLLGAVLYSGSMSANPALPSPSAQRYSARKPVGVFLVTRHPMMWSFALWGIAHILIAPRSENFIFLGSIIFLALVGAKAQEEKKAPLMGAKWDSWLRSTSYWPSLSGFVRVGPLPWVSGIVIWVIATWAHGFFDVPAAGLFRWL